jgi:hypothetical protein
MFFRRATPAIIVLLLCACAANPSSTATGADGAPPGRSNSSLPDTQGSKLTAAQIAAGQTYRAMLEAAQNDPSHMDWSALRQAYAASPAYDPASGNGLSMRETNMAAARGDWAQVVTLAEAETRRNWMNMPAHFLAQNAYLHLGNQAAASPHTLVANAFVHGLVSGGNGRTPQTAFSVLGTAEEYIVLSALHGRMQKQELRQIDGHWFDILTFVKPPAVTPGQLYFAIDTMFARESALATGATLVTVDQIPG